MSFTRKRIDVSLSMAAGNFGSGGNSATITGHRVLAYIFAAGGQTLTSMECAIYGLPLSLMNQLTTMGTQYTTINKNSISLSAYEEGKSPALVFKGTIFRCFPDMRALPQACLRIFAQAGLIERVMQAQPTSIQGSADVAQVMQQVAKKAGLQFENSGVNTKVVNPYLWGSPGLQIRHLAEMAGVEHIIDRGTVAIWPPDQPRQGGGSTISPQTGMIGYPTYTDAGLEVRTLFDPSIQYGSQVTVQSDLTPACGTWQIINLEYTLEAEVPRGRWECLLTLNRTGSGGDAP